MSDTVITIHDVRVRVCTREEKKLKSERDALDLIGEILYEHVDWVVIPVEQLDDDFFQLKTGLAGQVLQKFVTYRQRLVILGDISGYVAQSRAFRGLVYESNRGNQVWFVMDWQEFEERLAHTDLSG